MAYATIPLTVKAKSLSRTVATCDKRMIKLIRSGADQKYIDAAIEQQDSAWKAFNSHCRHFSSEFKIVAQ
jgi:hypothetical protein